jgi:hypothetical protein
MGEQEQDTGTTGAGPLENALQGDTEQGSDQAKAGARSSGGSIGSSASTGRASFTTPGAVSSIHDMAAQSESFSDPIAGEAEAEADLLEEAKRKM